MKKRKSEKYLVIGNVHLGTDDNILQTLSTVAQETGAQVVHTGNICTYNEKSMYDRRVHKLKTFENIEQEKHQEKVDKLKGEIKLLEKDIKDHKPVEKKAKKLNSKVKKLQQDLNQYAKKKDPKESYDAKTREKVQAKREELTRLRKELKDYESDINRNVRLLEKRDNLFNKLDFLEEVNEAKRKQLEDEMKVLKDAERSRIDKLKEHFPGIQFIANDEQCIGNHKEVLGEQMTMSKYIDVHSVNANGDKVSSQPITDRAFRYLKNQQKSVIMPHPAPALSSYEKEGLNNAWNMYTTGCLLDTGDPKRPSEFYKSTYLPSGLLVSVDEENGEYHASRLHFDTVRCPFRHRPSPVVLHDGIVYTGSGVVELPGKNCAVYSTDDHAPYEHMGVLAAGNALCQLSEAETFINGGDACDWSSICPHNKGKPRQAENRRFSDDKRAFKRLLDAQTTSEFIKRKVLIDANHEFWLERYVDEHPEMEGVVDQKTLYEELIPDWEYHVAKAGEDYTFYFGDLPVRHGHKENLAKAGKLFFKYLGGHFHSHNEYLRCASSGAGCRLGPRFLEGNLTKWQNCIGTLTEYKGVTSFDIKSVLHDKKKRYSRFSWQGEIYEVPFHEY